MLTDVRTKTFLPDCTRSGRFANRVVGESAVGHEPVESGSQEEGAAIDGGSEAEWYRAAGEAARGPFEDFARSDSFEHAEPHSSSEWVVPSGDHLDEDHLPLDGAWDEEPPVPAGAGVTDNEERSRQLPTRTVVTVVPILVRLVMPIFSWRESIALPSRQMLRATVCSTSIAKLGRSI